MAGVGLMTTAQKPSIGAVVHYVSYGTPKGEYPSRCCAAIVTEMESDTVVGLCVLSPTGQSFNQHVKQDAYQAGGGDTCDYFGGTWHWPEQVD
jgi:hypothetical protein